jgi:hypothetical protein
MKTQVQAKVIYTVTADDSADLSDGVTFSLAAGSDAALSIDAATGAVSLSADPDAEAQSHTALRLLPLMRQVTRVQHRL